MVETGTIVTGANSFVSVSDYVAYCASLGVTITDTAAAEVDLLKAMQVLATKEPLLMGFRVERDQPLCFPRTGLCIDGWAWQHDEIPFHVKNAQMALALDYKNGVDPLNPEPAKQAVTSETVVGAVSVSYASSNQGGFIAVQSLATKWLNMLLRSGSGYLSVPLLRS